MRPRMIVTGPPAHDHLLAERAQIMADIRRLEQFMDDLTADCCRVQWQMQLRVQEIDLAIRDRTDADIALNRAAKGRAA